MSKLKIIDPIHLRFFSAALLATTATHCLKPPQVKASSRIELVRLEAAIAQSDRDLSLIGNARNSASVSSSTDYIDLLAQTAATDTEKNPNDERTELIRRLVLAFFLLFFVPLGIFYPLFLFYKMLLVKPEDEDSILPNEQKPNIQDFPRAANFPTERDLTKATVSKLQIAFTPPAQELRKELSRVSLSANADSQSDLVKLMHQTAEVLIEQGHWTHISHSSLTLPLNLVRPEFDSISNRERHKFNSKQSKLGDRHPNSEGYERNYSYVVVTLIFCTTHDSPLFPIVNTKEQLVGQLERLKNMQEDAVIRFELLWNPQQEGLYLSNDRLLIEYAEMTRLF